MRSLRCGIILCALALLCTPAGNAAEKQFAFTVKKGDMLDVRTHEGSIMVQTWEKDEVSVRLHSLDEDRLTEVTAVQGGGKILVEDNGYGDLSIVVRVPVTFDLELKTGAGDIGVKGELKGELRGTTGGGDIALGKTTGGVTVQTAGGDITSEEVTGDGRFRTAGGGVSVKGVTGLAEISTAGGDIVIGAIGKTLHASTAGGDVRLESVGGDCEISTAGGNITVGSGAGKTSLQSAGGDIELRTGKGNVYVNTAGGNITLHNIQGSVRARSSAGDITVMLDPSVGESSSISTGAGNITLAIPSDAKATIQARCPDLSGEDESGPIQSDFPVIRRKGGDVEIQVNGGGHKVMLETKVGEISIKKK
jgi:DUF4097 and DUF4098 domain-containing protein YvlB